MLIKRVEMTAFSFCSFLTSDQVLTSKKRNKRWARERGDKTRKLRKFTHSLIESESVRVLFDSCCFLFYSRGRSLKKVSRPLAMDAFPHLQTQTEGVQKTLMKRAQCIQIWNAHFCGFNSYETCVCALSASERPSGTTAWKTLHSANRKWWAAGAATQLGGMGWYFEHICCKQHTKCIKQAFVA